MLASGQRLALLMHLPCDHQSAAPPLAWAACEQSRVSSGRKKVAGSPEDLLAVVLPCSSGTRAPSTPGCSGLLGVGGKEEGLQVPALHMGGENALLGAVFWEV